MSVESIMKEHLNDFRKKIKLFQYRDDTIQINNSNTQINLITINKKSSIIAYFLEIKDDKNAYYFLLNIETILSNIYNYNAKAFFNKKFQNLTENEKSYFIGRNQYSILSELYSKSCVNLYIDLSKNKAHILFIKKDNDCELKFLKEKGALANLVYISLKLFQSIGYNGNVYLDDNLHIKNTDGRSRSLSLLSICNEILEGLDPSQYSKYNYYGFYINSDKILDLETFIKSLNRNKCSAYNSILNAKLYDFLVNLTNTNYRKTIHELESKLSNYSPSMYV